MVSDELMRISDDYWRDAHAEVQSQRSRIDCAFEAGYCALLSVLTNAELRGVEHPSAKLLAKAARTAGVDAVPGLAAMRKRYSPFAERQTLGELLTWAKRVREAVKMLG